MRKVKGALGAGCWAENRAAKYAPPGTAGGFALVPALFLIVVLAALGGFAVRIGLSQQQTVDLSLLGNRALAAANSGIDWGAAKALSATPSCAPTTDLSFTSANGGALAGFTVTVTCTSTDHTDNSTSTYKVYRIDAFARMGTYGTSDYVSRRVYATFAGS